MEHGVDVLDGGADNDVLGEEATSDEVDLKLIRALHDSATNSRDDAGYKESHLKEKRKLGEGPKLKESLKGKNMT